jgi:uncharacterized Zn ribbon protein
LSSGGNGNGNKKGKMIEWRRNKVQQLLVQGHSQWDIADELKIDQSTVSRDIQCLRQQAQENLKTHIQNKLPEEYERCLTGMNRVLKLSWQIANNNNNVRQNSQDYNDSNSNTLTTGDDRTRLQALSLINDCYKYIMDLTINGIVITDAIKFVQTNKEKLTAMSNREEENGKESKEPDYDEDENQLEERQEKETGEIEEETTNKVF